MLAESWETIPMLGATSGMLSYRVIIVSFLYSIHLKCWKKWLWKRAAHSCLHSSRWTESMCSDLQPTMFWCLASRLVRTCPDSHITGGYIWRFLWAYLGPGLKPPSSLQLSEFFLISQKCTQWFPAHREALVCHSESGKILPGNSKWLGASW